MKREDIKAIFAEATDEQLNKIMDLNGSDVEKVKGKVTALEAEMKEKKTAFDNLNRELENLKTSNASAEDWKTKYDELAERQRIADEEKQKAEAEAAARADFESVAVGTDGKPLKWSHEAIKESYFKKYVEAKTAPEYQGKTGADIFHALTKDDAGAFKTVQTQFILPGANPNVEGATDKAVFEKMGYKERLKLYTENKPLYDSLTNKGE